MKQLSLLTLASASLLGIMTSSAQESKLFPELNVAMDMRGDWTWEHRVHMDGGDGNSSGFHGRYLNVMVNGKINDKFSFSLRQRLNKFAHIDNDAFSATDWAYLAYQPTKNFEIAAGKQVLLVGGYEYDAAPIDIYFASRYWNNIACYQFGASAAYITNNGKHTITAQICNSPYQGLSSSMYAYNLFWNGDFGWFKTLWSVNMIEYEKGKYCNYIALGNRFTFDFFDLQIDLMNRNAEHQRFWGKDFSVIAKGDVNVTPWLTVEAKGGYDRLYMLKDYSTSMPGTQFSVEKPFYGGGLEFYPMKGSRNVRIHTFYYIFHDNHGVKTQQINIGLKWRIDIYNKH